MWDEIIHTIVNWLKNELTTSQTEGYVLGVSGGLDSAVCAALVRKASRNCLGLILPIETSVTDLDYASEIAYKLNLKTQYIDLTSVYKSLKKFLPNENKIALGNIKARLRMIATYYYANKNNYLVCGTGNKTELTIGYFTKYGDGGCDVLPIGDLYKYEVREIAQKLNIPDKIVRKVPSAGLWLGQTDEREIGFSYGEIDKTLKQIEKGRVEGKCAEALNSMIEKSEHKRKLPRICKVQ